MNNKPKDKPKLYFFEMYSVTNSGWDVNGQESTGKFPEETELLTRQPCFPVGLFQTEIRSCFIQHPCSLKPYSFQGMLNFVSTTMAGSLGNLHMDYAFGLKQKFPPKISENFHKKQPQFFKCSLSLLVLNLRVSQVIVFHLQNWIINMGYPVVALCNKKN